jgi:hypothetical protein
VTDGLTGRLALGVDNRLIRKLGPMVDQVRAFVESDRIG